jgi:hypothetical protein
MENYIKAQGFDVWKSILHGYKAPSTPPTDRDGNKLEENDSRDRNTIENGVDQSIHTNIMQFEYEK